MKLRQTPKPTFFWQGALLLLPAAVLAVLGFIALRQDRLVVYQQAAEQARKLANDVVHLLLPTVLEVKPPPSLVDVHGTTALPTRPGDDAVFAYASQPPGWVIFCSATNGQLLYPLPQAPLVATATQAVPILDEAAQAAWDKAQIEEFKDPVKAIASYDHFLSGAPPARFAAQALYRTGVLLAQSGQTEAARDRLLRVRREFPEAIADTGVPLAFYSGLHLLELPPELLGSADMRSQLLDAVSGTAVLRFPLLAPALLERLDREGSNGRSELGAWRGVFAAQEQARRLHALCQRSAREENGANLSESGARWIESGEEQARLVLRVPAGSNLWSMALPQARAASWLETGLRGLVLPEVLGLQVRVAGRELASAPGEELARAQLPGTHTRPSAEVSVRLANPELLYRQQRNRTYWYGSLIGLACLTMIIGIIATRRAFARQRQLSQLRGNFVASVSHELRAPIASVRLMAEKLDDLAGADIGKSQSYHGFIVQECRRLSALIENVLDFSRHEQGRQEYQFEPTNLPGLIEATAKLMRTYAADKQIQIVTQLPAEPIELEADGRALQQVLINLIDNALKHSPARSTVTVGLEGALAPGASGRQKPPSRWRRLRALLGRNRAAKPQAVLRLWVEDQGEGIDQAEQERIFERFYRPGSELRRQTQGVGLGLAIVRYVTEAHGGKVRVRSALGQGSRFTIELPLEPPNAAPDRLVL